jgi:hypothetical protein
MLLLSNGEPEMSIFLYHKANREPEMSIFLTICFSSPMGSQK